MVYQRGNQRDGSPHYVFLYSDDENSGDEDNIPLQQRNRSTSLPRKVEVINVLLKSEDTLQALALRYRCTISELKRINKIHKENEIHARRFIKVPIQPFSILTETLEQNQSVKQAGQSEVSISTGEEIENAMMKGPLLDLMKNPVTTELPKAEINTIILNSVCEPLSSYNNSNSLEITSSECDQLLTSVENKTNNSHLTDSFKCSGDDCGLSWTQLLGFSLLLGFAGPIIYILYIAEFSSKNHSIANH
ncbi:LysM and putative peptidoglycan-binding domain-containing protein 3 [Habropoda laboriosa]|uniref:LysM and putative peptidoglycan-binding domain-containing protein 3 n=1 Tax=Habropoda laboriosa TaxID=597456 RepID=A0A0L7R1T5_9HYME|nr:PREDICTED: lysM and putative peptidoglycan-binding domain-containing protein 3 [Habropoda laboriosa]XP_017790840.1 PREDICTED: lysM and putative peptidoglycan-binding domain-containing protein 3 [Habropoda laboriosa]KOC64804.1 LysM and putative peptidoglycan-binding domain-containing protein 3 [Habropoda laboriosa]